MKRRKFIRKNAEALLAGALTTEMFFDEQPQKSQKKDKNPFMAGFAQADITSCIVGGGTFRKPLETVCASLNYNGTRTIILTLDLMEMPHRENLRIQKDVSARTGIAEDRIIIHTTHTHAVPWNADAGYTETRGLPEVLSRCISEAVQAEKPAFMKTGNFDVGKTLSIYRLDYAGEELGYQTFWYGYAYRDDDPRPDASPLIREMKSRWRNQTPVFSPGKEPVWFDREVDPLVQTIQFEDKRGRALGTMVRFSAHPHITNHCINRKFDPDYPAFVRSLISGKTRAPAMFFSGTCGNTVPKDKVKFSVADPPGAKFPYMGPVWGLRPESDEKLLSEVERIGEDIGKAGIKSVENKIPAKVKTFVFNSTRVTLPLDPNLPASKEEQEKMKSMLLEELNASSKLNAPLRELRGIANRLNWVDWAGSCGLRSLTPEDRKKGTFDLPVTVLQLDNTLLVFMNSEISVETTLKLREKFPDLNLFTVGLTGGTTGYLPTAQMVDEGGYEGRSSVFRRDAEELLRRGIGHLLQKVSLPEIHGSYGKNG